MSLARYASDRGDAERGLARCAAPRRQGNQGQTPRLFGLGLKMAGTDHALRKRVRRSENGYAAMGVGLTGGHAGGWLGVGAEPAERRWRKCIAATRV